MNSWNAMAEITTTTPTRGGDSITPARFPPDDCHYRTHGGGASNCNTTDPADGTQANRLRLPAEPLGHVPAETLLPARAQAGEATHGCHACRTRGACGAPKLEPGEVAQGAVSNGRHQVLVRPVVEHDAAGNGHCLGGQ